MSTVEPFTISRIFKAPRALVFQCHTDVAHLAKWYGPAGTKVIKADLDFRVGGTYHYGLALPDGSEMWGKQVYREIVVPQRLVFVQSFSNPSGEIIAHPMAATWPRQMLATSTFEDLGDKTTKLTVTWLPLDAGAEEIATFDHAREGMNAGFNGTFDQLTSYLEETATKLTVARLIRAPREKVWAALTDSAQVNVWWGPTGFQNIDVEQDVRVGGVWRFTMVGPDGTRYPNRCVYREIVALQRLAYEHGDDESVHFQAVITLDELDGATLVTLQLTLPSREARDAVVEQVGAIEGGRQTLTKLDAFMSGGE